MKRNKRENDVRMLLNMIKFRVTQLSTSNAEMQFKVGDEADEWNERIEGEASATRRVLTSVTRHTGPVSPPSYSSNSNTSLPQRKVDSGLNNLERIRIPTFSDITDNSYLKRHNLGRDDFRATWPLTTANVLGDTEIIIAVQVALFLSSNDLYVPYK